MKSNKISIVTFISLFVILQVSCSTKPALQSQPKSEEVLSSKAEMSPRLYQYLASSGIKIKKVDHAEIITAFEVYCKVALPDGNHICTFKNGSRKYTISKQVSESFADLLFGLNLSQGDSGVVASFIECSKFIGEQIAYSCDVAIPLDYKKP